MKLKPPQKRYLRGQAHHLKPVLQSGAKGVTPAFQYALVAGNTLLLMAPLVWIGGIAVLCQQLFPENTRSWLWAIAATFPLVAR